MTSTAWRGSATRSWPSWLLPVSSSWPSWCSWFCGCSGWFRF